MINYDNFSKTFSNSRKNMKWEEINYFINYLIENEKLKKEQNPPPPLYQGGIEQNPPSPLFKEGINEAPLIKGEANEVSRGILENGELQNFNYLGIDSSSGLIEEAKKLFPKNDFLVLDMKNLDDLSLKNYIHSLQNETEQNPLGPLFKEGINEAPLIKGEANEVSRGILENGALNILDVGCGNGRLLNHLLSNKISEEKNYKYIPYNPELKEKSRELRNNMTEAEKKLWYDFLRNIDEKVLRQKPLLDYIVDFYIPSYSLIIEIDGDSHFQPNYLEYEKKRTKDLESNGLEIIRFTNIEVYEKFEGVCCNIIDKIKSKQNPPNPLYQGGIEQNSSISSLTNSGQAIYKIKQKQNHPSPLFKEGINEAPLIKGEANEVSRGISDTGDLLTPNSKNFDYIFFIASFHHLKTIEERLEVLKQAKKILKKDGIIFMTNWDLQSNLNNEKYKSSIIPNSKNQFGSQDYSIKIGKFTRFYHSFSTKELDYLFQKSGFQIIENKLFENERNIVSVVSF